MSRARKARTSIAYIEFLDGKLGYPKGTIYNLCVSALKSKVATKDLVKVTYRGVNTRQKRIDAHKSIQLRKSIFLIEFSVTKDGQKQDRADQVHLEM